MADEQPCHLFLLRVHNNRLARHRCCQQDLLDRRINEEADESNLHLRKPRLKLFLRERLPDFLLRLPDWSVHLEKFSVVHDHRQDLGRNNHLGDKLRVFLPQRDLCVLRINRHSERDHGLGGPAGRYRLRQLAVQNLEVLKDRSQRTRAEYVHSADLP